MRSWRNREASSYRLPPGGGGIDKVTNQSPKGEKVIQMSYKKPEIVAQSAAKESFVAGCPEKTLINSSCSTSNKKCMVGDLR